MGSRCLLALAFAVLSLTACGETKSGGSNASSAGSHSQSGTIQASVSAVEQNTARAPKTEPTRRVAYQAGASRASSCPPGNRVLAGVYHPSRLRLLDPCRRAEGRVALVRHEPDGDLHIDVALDARYRDLLARANYSQQHGDLVV